MMVALLSFLVLAFLSMIVSAGNLDVLPVQTLVPQCSIITARWSQKPPLHLHVQPEDSITLTNLVDMGVQNGTSTTFQVSLPIGQNFSFAYNTLANEFLVFQSNVMQVVAGNTDCLTTTVSALSPPALTSQAASSSAVPTSLSSPSPSPSKSDATAVSTTSATLARASARSGPSIGAVVAIILAVSAIFLVGLALFWRSHRTWMKQMAEANADQERPPSEKPQGRFLGAVLGRAEGPSPLPYREETPPPPITPPKSWFVGTRAAISPGASSSDGRGQQDFTPDSGDGPHDKLRITIPPQTRRFVVSNAATPVVHTDGGVRLLVSERDLPPVYYKYS